MAIERTFSIIKPDATARNLTGAVNAMIEQAGLRIIAQKRLRITKDQAETSVLFELISARYERRSLLITANQPFGEWGKVFPDPAMTLAAVDRLVHHSTIFELNVESYRRRTGMQRKQHGPGRPATFATPKNVGVPTPRDKQPAA